MRKFKFASLAVIVVAAIIAGTLLSGCSNDKKASETFIGTWDIVRLESGGQDMTDMLNLMREMGAPLTFEISGDNTLKIDMTYDGKGEVIEGTWKAKDADTIVVTIKDDAGNDNSADIDYSDGEMVLDQKDIGKLVCRKHVS